MTLKQMRAACLGSMADGDIEPDEGRTILAAIEAQIAAGRDPDLPRTGRAFDLGRLPSKSEVMFEQLSQLGRAAATAGRQGIGAPDVER